MNTRGSLGLLGGLALATLGIGGFLIGSSLAEARPPVAGANLPINAGATDLRDISANNSPSLARNPSDANNLVVVNRIDTPRFSCGVNVSLDAGRNWVPSQLPFPTGEELPERCFAPDLAFGPDGMLYVSFVTLKGKGNTPSAAWTVRSHDGGRRFGIPSKAAGSLTFQVRIIADAHRAGRLYLSWLQASQTGTLLFPNTGNPIMMAQSDNGGETWRRSVRVSSPSRERVVAPAPAQGPVGDLYLLYLDLGADKLDYAGGHAGRGGPPFDGKWGLVCARSSDGGNTWSEALVDGGLTPINRFIVFFPPTPSLAIDQDNGRLYAAFHDGRLGDADVLLWTSIDRGVTFGSPVRVNDTPPHDGTWQYMPMVGVSPNGRVDVVYYDRRDDPKNVFNAVSFQSSSDGGRSFTPHINLSDRPFDSQIGFGSLNKLADLGSRLALLSSDQRAFAIWTDTRAGTRDSSKQDLSGTGVAFHEASSLRAPLRVGGLAATAFGLVVVTSGLLIARLRSGSRSDAGRAVEA